VLPAVDRVLAEFRESGLALAQLPGNSAKLRLALDLAAQLPASGRLRVLDVGCAGPTPLNLWAPFVPLRERLDIVGVDVAGLERAEARARELDFPMVVRRASALDLSGTLGSRAFDAVVSTQVLEHVPDWRAALGQMAGVLRAGGRLYATCDSAQMGRSAGGRVRLVGKRSFARLARRAPRLASLAPRPLSGEWERGLERDELRRAIQGLGLEVETLSLYCLQDVKVAQRWAGSATRQLWLALEEALADELAEEAPPSLYGVCYLRARAPS
jgi:SAM-dependent methyltransferase